MDAEAGTPDINKRRALSWSKITDPWGKNQGPYRGQADSGGVVVRLEMTAQLGREQCLLFIGMVMAGRDDVWGCCGCIVSLLPSR